MWRLKVADEVEIYDRIVDLSRKVVKGEIDPLDLEISSLVSMLSKIDVDKLPYELFMRDVEALNGLSIILYYQKDSLRRVLEGLRIDSVFIKTILLSLDIRQLESLARKMLRPPAEISVLSNDDIVESLVYFKNIRRISPEFRDIPVNIEGVDVPIEEDIRKEMLKMYRDLKDRYGSEPIDYSLLVKDNPIYKAYLLSILASEGYIDIRHDRVRDRIFVNVNDPPRRHKNPVSLPIVVSKYGYGEEG